MEATKDQQLLCCNRSEEEDDLLLPARSDDHKPQDISTNKDYTIAGCSSSQYKEISTDSTPQTAHQISSDSWQQVAFVLSTGINSAYVLSYSATFMVPLGWIGGVLGLILANAFSLYASSLIAKVHNLGGKRHIRYRDLAGHVYGDYAYALTWGLQYVNLFMTNAGYIVLAGQSIKSACILFLKNEFVKLPYCIFMAGSSSILFAVSVPDLSRLRIWLGVSSSLTIIYSLAAIFLSVNDGINSPPRDYSIPLNSHSNFYSVIGASASLVFAFNTGMLPEIQATIRRPVVSSMMKALYFQFTVGVLPMYIVCFFGYWAYGSSTSTYLLRNGGGNVWVKATANMAALFQSIICLHIFACPMYEFVDTYFSDDGSPFLTRGLMFRVAVRGGYVFVSTFVSAMLPFLGDFMSLSGAVSVIPLTFVLGNHMYFVAKRNKLNAAQKLWHLFNVAFFSCFSFVAVVAAFRLIAVDSATYRFFADL